MNRRAFTLLELVVAMFMFAVVVGSLYAVVQAVLRMRESMYTRLESVLPRDHAAQIIRRDLANVVPASGLFAGAMDGEKVEDQGVRRDTLELYTTSGIVSDATPWGDLQKVEYSVESMDGGSTLSLVRRVTRNFLATTQEDPVPEKILDDVDTLTLTYYDGQDWQDSWDANTLNAMPEAISFVVTFADPNDTLASGGGLFGRQESAPSDNARPTLELLVPIVVQTVDTAQGGSPGGSLGGGGGSR